MALIASLFIALFMFSTHQTNALSSNYYDKTCPSAEYAITKLVRDATKKDSTVPAALLRLHFHDCFIRGCDASVLLNSKKNTAEKDGLANHSLHAYFVIDAAKKIVEDLCPGIVSCADILAFAARDAVVVVRFQYQPIINSNADENKSELFFRLFLKDIIFSCIK
ncbi:peroxidase [Lithospermum erythrorhizon]|uniref:peroxidase n=1 Tax=Lithospermum erythrorhizon TaxID=34254 RepID=A0AAV3NXD3_LITER